MKVWVRRYRIQYDMFDAIQVSVISEEEAERINREFKEKWPEVESKGASAE